MGRCVVLSVALFALTACTDRIVAPAATDRSAIFDQLWTDVDRHYPYLDLKGTNWDSLGRVYRPLAVSAPDEHAFAMVLGKLLAELHDVHVALLPNGVTGTLRYIGVGDTATADFDAAETTRLYVADARATTDQRVIYGMLDTTVAYVRVPSFVGRDWAHDMDEALGSLPGAGALVLDVRSNAGGTRSLALDVAGRFADRERTFGYLRFRSGPRHGELSDFIAQRVVPSERRFTGPVYLLTNRRNTSSTEDLVLAMKVLPNVTVVGDTTAGATGGPIIRELANGWTYQLSQWIEYTALAQPFEEMGLPPDVAVKPTADDRANARDVVLERALALARGRLAQRER